MKKDADDNSSKKYIPVFIRCVNPDDNGEIKGVKIIIINSQIILAVIINPPADITVVMALLM